MHLMRYSNVSPSRSGRSRGWPVWLSISVTFGDLLPYGPRLGEGLFPCHRPLDDDLVSAEPAGVLARLVGALEHGTALRHLLRRRGAGHHHARKNPVPVEDRERGCERRLVGVEDVPLTATSTHLGFHRVVEIAFSMHARISVALMPCWIARAITSFRSERTRSLSLRLSTSAPCPGVRLALRLERRKPVLRF